jgi:hypothetical protein
LRQYGETDDLFHAHFFSRWQLVGLPGDNVTHWTDICKIHA